MTGRITPLSTSGQTCSRTAATIAAFCSFGRARRVVEVTEPRLAISVPRFSSALEEPFNEVLLPVVDQDVRAELAARRQLFPRSRRHGHDRARVLPELDGH